MIAATAILALAVVAGIAADRVVCVAEHIDEHGWD